MKSRLGVVLAEKRRTRTEVARALGVSRSRVSVWSTDDGMASLTLRKVEGLAEELGCRVGDLFEEDGPAVMPSAGDDGR